MAGHGKSERMSTAQLHALPNVIDPQQPRHAPLPATSGPANSAPATTRWRRITHSAPSTTFTARKPAHADMTCKAASKHTSPLQNDGWARIASSQTIWQERMASFAQGSLLRV